MKLLSHLNNLLGLQCTCCTVPISSGRPQGSLQMYACQWFSSQPLSSLQLTHNNSLWTLGITKSHREQGLDYREGDELSWCPSWSNRLWQGWSCGLVHFPRGNATDPIWRVLASSDGISTWTPLKPQQSNPNPNPLANQLRCIYFLTCPTPLIIPHRLPAFLESIMPLKTDARFMQDAPKAIKHSIRFWDIFPKFKQNLLYIVLLKSPHVHIAYFKFTSGDNQ